MKKKQTAVEWLIEQVNSEEYQKAFGQTYVSIELVEQAKKLELEQIVKAYRTTPTARWTNTFGIRYFNKHYGYNYSDNTLDSNKSNG